MTTPPPPFPRVVTNPRHANHAWKGPRLRVAALIFAGAGAYLHASDGGLRPARADDVDPGLTSPPADPARPLAEPPSEAAPAPATPAPPREAPQPPESNAELERMAELPLEVLLDQKVETATKTATAILEIPNRVVVVTDQEIKRRGYRYLIELVEDLPGVQVMNEVEAETGAHVIVRGIWQNNKILVLYAGHKITSPEGKDFIFGRHDWSLANVKRVEFIYGPASSLYGADAVSAVINIVPKDEHDLAGHKIEATAGYGVDKTVEADLATGFGAGPLAVRVDGAIHHSAGPNFLDRYPDYYQSLRSPDYARQGGEQTANGDPVWVAPSYSYHVAAFANLGEHTRMHFLRIYSEEQSAMGFRPPLFEFSPQNKFAWWQNNAGITHEIQLTDEIVSRSLITYNHQACDPKTQFINSFFDGGQSFTRADYKMFRSLRFGATQELVYRSTAFGNPLQAVVGARFEDIYSLSKISTITGEPASLRYPLNYQTNNKVPNGEVNFQAYGVYGQIQHEISSHLNLVAGVNVDKVWYYNTAVNPRVGMTFAANEALTLRASAAKAYLVPAPAYQFEGFNDAKFPEMGSVGAIPNTDLKPEDYRTYEAGATAAIARGLFLVDVSAYHTSNDNYLLRQRLLKDPNVQYTPTIGNVRGLSVNQGGAIFTSENGGRVRAYGGEVFVTANIASPLRAWVSYALTLGSQQEEPTRTGTGIHTDYLANQSDQQVKGGVELKLGKFALTPSVVWYAHTRIRPDAMDTVVVANGLDPFTLFNLSAVWEGEHYELWARAQNLFNVRYYRPGGPVSQQAATEVPQAGLTGQVGVRVKY